VTIEDVRDWEKHEVTIEFFNRLRWMEKEHDELVHTCLKNRKEVDAGNFNASLDIIREVLAGPDVMVEDLKKE